MDFEFIEPSSSTSSTIDTASSGCTLLPENSVEASSTATVDQSKPNEKSNPLTIEIEASHYGELLALKKYYEQIIKDAKLEVKPLPASAFIKTEPPIVSNLFEQTDIKIEEDGIASNGYYDNDEIIPEDFVKAELLDHSGADARKTASNSPSRKFATNKTVRSMIDTANSSAPKLPNKKQKKGRPPKPRDDSDTPPKMFECPICKIAIRSRISNLKRHMKMKHSEGSKVYNCPNCDFQCHRNMEMRKHIAEHKKSFECVWCKKIFNSTKGMRQHMMCHVRNKDPNQPKKYICIYCAQSFTKSAECKRHEENHSGVRAHECDQCFSKFRNKFDLRAHKRRVHSDQARKCEAVPCKVCGKILSTPSNLREHMRVHSDLRYESIRSINNK